MKNLSQVSTGNYIRIDLRGGVLRKTLKIKRHIDWRKWEVGTHIDFYSHKRKFVKRMNLNSKLKCFEGTRRGPGDK